MKRLTLYIFSLLPIAYLGCSSVEYEIDEYQVTSTEKKLVYDTIRTYIDTSDITKKDIKEDLNKNKDIKTDLFTYTCQIGAYIVIENYERFLSRAKSKLGDAVFTVKVDNLNKIRIGTFDVKSEAVKYMIQLQAMGFSDAFVVKTKK